MLPRKLDSLCAPVDPGECEQHHTFTWFLFNCIECSFWSWSWHGILYAFLSGTSNIIHEDHWPGTWNLPSSAIGEHQQAATAGYKEAKVQVREGLPPWESIPFHRNGIQQNPSPSIHGKEPSRKSELCVKRGTRFISFIFKPSIFTLIKYKPYHRTVSTFLCPSIQEYIIQSIKFYTNEKSISYI